MTRTPVDLALDAIADFTPTTPAQVHMLLELWRGRWALEDADVSAIVAAKVGWLADVHDYVPLRDMMIGGEQ